MNIYQVPEQHAMTLLARHPDGADEFYCETCGRRMLIHWPPEYKKTVLEPGNEYAVHTGSKGGLSLGAPLMNRASSADDTLPADDIWDAIQADNIPDPETNERKLEKSIEDDDPNEAERLARWDNWLNQAGFNSWWERDL